jgi:GNAT superfamily N-acetyltransferase
MSHQGITLSQPLTFRTRRGQLVAVRQGSAADATMLAELLGRLSERARHLRYMSPRRFSVDGIWNEAMRMTRGHPFDHTTLVATMRTSEYDEAVAVAELVRDQANPTTGEIALVVRDDAQRQGIGSFLLRHLVHAAQHNGITRLSANMLAENAIMLRLIGGLGLPFTATTSYGETHALIALPGQQKETVVARGAPCSPRERLFEKHCLIYSGG